MPMLLRAVAARVLGCSVLCLVSCQPSRPAAAVPPSAPSTRLLDAVSAVSRDSIAAERDSLIRIERQRIAGREAEPATKVFENVQVLTENVSAANLVQAMGFY